MGLFKKSARIPGATPVEPSSRTVDPYLGVPLLVNRPNASFVEPYCADRAGLRLRFAGTVFSPLQPASIWYSRERAKLPALLDSRADLRVGDHLTVVEDRPYDFAVGTLFAKVKRDGEDRAGYITLETFFGETSVSDNSLWAAADAGALRQVMETDLAGMPLYSPNRLLAEKASAGMSILERVAYDPVKPDPAQHPLGLGAEAQRVGTWALAAGRTSEERERASRAMRAAMQNYFIPAMRKVAPGAAAWPYPFDFAMPWGTRLKSPWYSGYANAAVANAAACAWRLTGEDAFRNAALEAVGFLRLPMSAGGALYRIDDYYHIAEYVYRSPPLPNYRVLDGEIISLVFLYDAALLLGDPELLHFVMQLGAGLGAALRLFCAEDGLPVFGMDGQSMNPDYMWQLWAALQMLAHVCKDRGFSGHARNWRRAIPEKDLAAGFPV